MIYILLYPFVVFLFLANGNYFLQMLRTKILRVILDISYTLYTIYQQILLALS